MYIGCMKVKTRAEAVNLIDRAVRKNPRIELCILYGSAARDQLQESSDLDLVLGADQPVTPSECLDLSLSLGGQTGREVSVNSIEKMEGLILREILNGGVIIKNTNPDFLACFIIKMYDFAEDLLPLQLEGQKTQIRRFLDE
jgi:predicted nucleotidyltransferase